MKNEDPKRRGRSEEIITRLAAEFIHNESNKSSLVTVIRTEIGNDMSTAKIFISVLPDDKKEEASAFLKRKRSDFREYMKEKAKLPKNPFVDFIVYTGEKKDISGKGELEK